MTKLNQVVAVEKTVKESVNKQTAPLFHAAKNAALFAGLSKTYESAEEGGEELPAESVRVQNIVQDVLEDFSKPMAKLFDVQFTKENANTGASADVVVDGNVLIKDAPVTFLLQFEKQLIQEVRGLIVSLPTLDPSQEWEASSSDRAGVYETPVVKRHRTKKIQRALVLYPAEGQHPAQTQLVTEDILAGYWSEKRSSGAITGQRKQELIEKIDKLIVAVKQAREAANNVTVEEKAVGAEVFQYLLS